jgi:hypothetical protein
MSIAIDGRRRIAEPGRGFEALIPSLIAGIYGSGFGGGGGVE